MYDHRIDDRRRMVRSNIDEALTSIERKRASRIELLAKGGVTITGDWARIHGDMVTVFSAVMDIVSSDDILLDDVLVVRTVWFDNVAPPFVAPSRFNGAFDQAFVQGVSRIFGRHNVDTVIAANPSIAKAHADMSQENVSQQDAVHREMRGQVATILRIKPDATILDLNVAELAEDDAGIGKALGEIPATVVGDIFEKHGRVAIRHLLDVDPVVATAIAVQWVRLDAQRRMEPYAPFDKLLAEVEPEIGRLFHLA